MQHNYKISFSSFVRWITQKYINLEKQTLPYPCKIAGFSVDKSGNYLIQVQLSGQSHIIEVNPEKIIDHYLFDYFSPQDKKSLFWLAYNKKQLELSDQYYCRNSRTQMVVLTDIMSGNKLTLPASTVSTDRKIINRLDAIDANKIGFLSGVNYSRSTEIKRDEQ